MLSIRNLTKRFPGVLALDHANFDLAAGEIHALMGENGAGKSTLIKVLNGVHRRDGGEITLNGNSISPSSPAAAERIGISTVFQEINLIPQLSVAENIALGRQPTLGGLIRWRQIKRNAQAALRRMGLDINVNRALGQYALAVQQMVAIARAIDMDCQALILDEPTSSLDENEVAQLFTVMRRLRDQGIGILFVTHFLNQVYEISDSITVLRNGKDVGSYPTARLSRVELVELMLGKSISSLPSPSKTSSTSQSEQSTSQSQTPFLNAKGFGNKRFPSIDLELAKGDVKGLAGLLGSGRTEIARLLFGLDAATTGALEIDQQPQRRWSPKSAIAAGLAYCPEDRKHDGVIGQLSVRENIVLALQAARSIASTLPLNRQIEIANHYIKQLNIKTPSCETAVSTLSGGNQQKVLLARWLAMHPHAIILDEPTRGIDVGAKSEIESLIADLQRDGIAVLLISSDIEELIRNCGQLTVLRDRKIIGAVTGEELDEKNVMRLIAAPEPTSVQS